LSLFLLVILAFTSYNIFYLEKAYPNTYIASINVTGMTEPQISQALQNNVLMPKNIEISIDGKSVQITTDTIHAVYNYSASAARAIKGVRTGNILLDFGLRLRSLFYKTNLGVDVAFDEASLRSELQNLDKDVSTQPLCPSVEISSNGIVVKKGQYGKGLNLDDLRLAIGQNLSYNLKKPIVASFVQNGRVIDDAQAEQYNKRAVLLANKSISMNFEYQNINLKGEVLLGLINPFGGYDQDNIQNEVYKIASLVNREPQDSVFEFDNNRVVEFVPSQDGISVEAEKLTEMIRSSLEKLESNQDDNINFTIPVESKKPKITTGEINDMGIKELIGRGSSKFVGSAAERIYNISLASSKFKGVLIKPDETFSFNDTVGDISTATGYKQAYIIKDGRTVLGDGGGTCQVSTTLFRAVLDAGLPIIERQAHAYRVGYYEQDSSPGLDATVYSPHPDLQFKNDTGNYILIQPIFNSAYRSLVFELYGTSDGRKSIMSKPVISQVTPPPEDLYVDDPTLPVGTIKQIDYKSWGAKVTFNYTVMRGAETIYKKTFISNYQPWQAVFLRGVGPAQ